ncbi:MAG: hypothetical protein ACRECV_09430 [Xanthobacteraceae bacterium]
MGDADTVRNELPAIYLGIAHASVLILAFVGPRHHRYQREPAQGQPAQGQARGNTILHERLSRNEVNGSAVGGRGGFIATERRKFASPSEGRNLAGGGSRIEMLECLTARDRNAAAIGDKAAGHTLSVGIELAANGHGVVHAGLAGLLFAGPRGSRCEREAENRHCQCNTNFHFK